MEIIRQDQAMIPALLKHCPSCHPHPQPHAPAHGHPLLPPVAVPGAQPAQPQSSPALGKQTPACLHLRVFMGIRNGRRILVPDAEVGKQATEERLFVQGHVVSKKAAGSRGSWDSQQEALGAGGRKQLPPPLAYLRAARL